MLNRDELGFRRAQGFALEQLITIQCVSTDLRWALLALIARSLTAMWAAGQARVAAIFRAGAKRLARRARRMAAFAAADITVAAGGR
jgi:hypothetical protein